MVWWERRFEVVARRRPVDLVSPDAVDLDLTPDAGTSDRALPQPASYAAVVADLAGSGSVHLAGDGLRVTTDLDDGLVSLRVEESGATTTRRSRRHGRTTGPVDGLALTLTGSRFTALTREHGTWTARALVDRTRVDPREPGWAATLRTGHQGAVTRLRAGGFGQLGLRDLRLVSHADGTAYDAGDGRVLLTASSAGPGFFDTGHTSVWSLDRDTLELIHRADLFVRRPTLPDGRTRVVGDHASHLVRDGGDWLLATSTWGDFDRRRRLGRGELGVRSVLARTGADLLTGRHVLDAPPLDLPHRGAVGVWDPHLLRGPDGWLVGYAAAPRFFRFHPRLAAGPDLGSLRVRAAAPRRTATEGTTLVRDGADGGTTVVVASDGRDGRRGQRASYPVLDLDLTQVGRLDAAYPTNLPWPTVVPPVPGHPERLLVGFDGERYGGPLLGYGTHGTVVVQRTVD